MISVGSKYEEHLSDALDDDLCQNVIKFRKISFEFQTQESKKTLPGHAKVMDGILDQYSI